jgi:GT2 family glycosyltransferase
MLGYIHGGWIRAEFLNSVLNAVSGPNADEAIGGVISSSAGPLVAMSRNLLAAQFLDSDLEWLLSADTDIAFSTSSISRLLAEADPVERPIVSALYHVFDQGRKVPAAYLNMTDGSELDLRPVEPASEAGVFRVAAVGCGFLLVHRTVFEEIRKENMGKHCWYREVTIDGRDFGEDISFCLRALTAGFPIYVNSDVRVGHIKSAMLGEVS